tara:strand:+ start:192 stop:317 length:126 start_codon:yes stop_codon:yes gene_type:complete
MSDVYSELVPAAAAAPALVGVDGVASVVVASALATFAPFRI